MFQVICKLKHASNTLDGRSWEKHPEGLVTYVEDAAVARRYAKFEGFRVANMDPPGPKPVDGLSNGGDGTKAPKEPKAPKTPRVPKAKRGAAETGNDAAEQNGDQNTESTGGDPDPAGGENPSGDGGSAETDDASAGGSQAENAGA